MITDVGLKNITLFVSDSKSDIIDPCKIMNYSITKDSLKECLNVMGINKSISSFLSGYSSADALAIYQYAENNNQILSENFSYTKPFMNEYLEFKQNGSSDLSVDEYYEKFERQSSDHTTRALFDSHKCNSPTEIKTVQEIDSIER